MKSNNIASKLLQVSLLVVVLTTSCSKDFLDVSPTGRIPNSEYLKTDDQAFSALVGVYSLFQWNYNRPWNSAYFVKSLLGDDINCGGGSSADQPPYQQINSYTFVSDNPAITGMWEGYYKTIGAANEIITKLNADTDSKKIILAEAKAIRAFSYFELTTMFGDIPLVLTPAANSSEYSLPKTAKAKVIEKVIADLTEAIPVLPAKKDQSMKFRFSKGAAQATLGKVYLYNKQYDLAAAQLDAVIGDNADYDLSTSYDKIWDSSNSLGKESIFAIQFSSSQNYNWGNFPWGGRPLSNIHIELEGPRDYFLLGNTGLINGWGFNLPTKKIWDAFVNAGDVVRRRASMLSIQELWAAGGKFSATADSLHVWGYEGFIRVKYATKKTETNTTDGVTPELNYSTAWLLIRTADVYLMAAEAYAGSNPAKACGYLNAVRSRASLPAVNLTGSALLSAIKVERELEFAFEGSRYVDLVRWGDANAELTARGYKQGKHNLLPIPNNEILSNTALTDKDQNPGY